jgi:hypothetical protein
MSPKRKVPMTITTELVDTTNNDTNNDTNDQLPTLLCHDNISSSSSYSVLETSKSIMNKLSDEDFLSDDELICFIKSCASSVTFNRKDIRTNEMSSDEETIINLTYTKIIPELSDDDLMKCVKHAYINKQNK